MSERAKVLLVGVTLPRIGGISLTIDKLKHNKLLQESIEVHVCNPNSPDHALLDRCLTRFLHYPANSQLNRTLLKASMRDSKPDIIHLFTSSYSNFWTNCYLSDFIHKQGIPYLLNMRGGGFIDFYQGCTDREKHKIVRNLRQANVLLVQSDEWGEYYRSLHQDIKISVLPNYVQIPDARDLSDSDRKNAILFLGHLKKSKGVALLLEAWQRLQPEIPGWELWLAGPDREGFADAVSEVELRQKRIRFHGVVQGEQKEKLLRQASIFVLPSEAEGLPNSMLEAMAYQIPVIATPVGAVPGIIRNAENGIIIEVGNRLQLVNAIRELAGSSARRLALGQTGYASVQSRHSERQFTSQLLDIYSSVIGSI